MSISCIDIIKNKALLDVVLTNKYWPGNTPSLYLTCKQMYRVWAEHLSGRVLLRILCEHRAQHKLSLDTKLPLESVIWGDICLHLAAQCFSSVDALFTVCGRGHIFNCADKRCKVFRVEIEPEQVCNQPSVSIIKYDYINDIHYKLVFATHNKEVAMSHLYDCTQWPIGNGYASLYINVYTKSPANFPCIQGIFGSKLNIFSVSGRVRNDLSVCNIIDNMYLECAPTTEMKLARRRLSDYINDNVTNIIAYMRSITISSAEYLPQLVAMCKPPAYGANTIGTGAYE